MTSLRGMKNSDGHFQLSLTFPRLDKDRLDAPLVYMSKRIVRHRHKIRLSLTIIMKSRQPWLAYDNRFVPGLFVFLKGMEISAFVEVVIF